MIESCFVLILICLAFFLFFQLCHAFASRDVLDHAAARAARARTVGFNRWMVRKAMRVAAIPNAGRMLEPADIDAGNDPVLTQALRWMTPGEVWDMAIRSAPTSPKIAVESARIPDYLASPHEGQAAVILDYEKWDEVSFQQDGLFALGLSDTIRVRVRQPLDMLISVVRAATGVLDGRSPETLRLEGTAEIESHYSHYLDDRMY